MFLFDRQKVKFRKDGYGWEKRADGRTVREDHAKLKVQGKNMVYSCYAHLQANSHFHRRCYWLLTDPRVIMVHYLNTEGMEITRTKSTRKGRGSNRQTTHPESQRSTPRPPRGASASKARTKAVPPTAKAEPTMQATPIPAAVPAAMQTGGYFDAGLEETSLVSMPVCNRGPEATASEPPTKRLIYSNGLLSRPFSPYPVCPPGMVGRGCCRVHLSSMRTNTRWIKARRMTMKIWPTSKRNRPGARATTCSRLFLLE